MFVISTSGVVTLVALAVKVKVTHNNAGLPLRPCLQKQKHNTEVFKHPPALIYLTAAKAGEPGTRGRAS